ncbi:hypothetical protein RRG08_023985 [Elysia crispata]|uniref:Uncharacterized protein n=1 Tax=Elysia crispata TaxID=231223 RepID=A0AAE1D231_9GAST|nr:hypothetical protein RRG08_023985 [Elysia crispata]
MRTQGYQNAETKRLIRATQRIEGSLQNTNTKHQESAKCIPGPGRGPVDCTDLKKGYKSSRVWIEWSDKAERLSRNVSQRDQINSVISPRL